MRTIVLGGGYAGVMCALRLARKSDDEVLLVDGRDSLVERVRLHERISTIPYAGLLAGTRVKFWQHWVEEIDPGNRRIDGEAFDRIVIATGSHAATPKMHGAERLLHCSTLDDARALHAADRSGPATVIGGGLTGIELAAELGATLVTRGAIALGEKATAIVKKHVNVIEHADVVAIEDDAVVTSDGRSIPSSKTIWAGGLSAAKIPLDLALTDDGRARTDPYLQSTSHPWASVIGDAAGAGLRMACATAMPMGAWVADHLAGRTEDPFRFSYVAQCVSLGRKRGVVQWVDPWDRPKTSAFGGRPAAWMKELLCRSTIFAMRLERRGIDYRWPKGTTPLLEESVA